MILLFSCSHSKDESNNQLSDIEHIVVPDLPTSVGNDILKNNTYQNDYKKYEFGKDGTVKTSTLLLIIDETEFQPEYIYNYTYNDENKMLYLSVCKTNFSLTVSLSKKYNNSPILSLCEENKGFLTYSEILSEINAISYDNFKKKFSNATEMNFQQEKREVLLNFKKYFETVKTYKVEQTDNGIALREYYSEDIKIHETEEYLVFSSLEKSINAYTDTGSLNHIAPVNKMDSALVISIDNENPEGKKGEVLVSANLKSYTISEITYWKITAYKDYEKIELLYNQDWDDGIIILTVEGSDSFSNSILDNKSYILYSNNSKTLFLNKKFSF